jgi:uncharacterized protein YkwD
VKRGVIVLTFAAVLLAAGCQPRVAIGPFVAAGGTSSPAPSPAQQIERDLVARLNAERVARGLRPVTVDPQLTQAARGWSQTMGQRDTMFHSDLSTWSAGYVAIAENVAWETSPGLTSGDMHAMWMHSDGHRHNILAPNVDRVGVGVACVNGKLWGTERFASVTSPNFGGMPPVNPIVRADRGALAC